MPIFHAGKRDHRNYSALPENQVLHRAIASVVEKLESRQMLSTTALNINDTVPFQHIVIDPSPGSTPVVKVFADLNGDGNLDAVIGHETTLGGGGLDWYQFPASGKATDPWTEHVIDPTADVYEAIRPYDLNGDSHMDLIVSERNTIYWYQNPGGNGTGTWAKHIVGNSPAPTHEQTVVTDLNGDGRVDIISNDTIFFQNSDGSFSPSSQSNFTRTQKGLALFDSGSGLGAVDLAGTGEGPNFNMGWWENPRDHGGNAKNDPWIFHSIGSAYPGYSSGGGISYAAMDVNGDGRQDIVTCFGEANNFLPGGLIWWEAPANRATGTWIQHTIDSTAQYVHNLVVADVNGDGTPDLLVFEQDQSAQQRLMIDYNEGGTGQNWLVQTLETTGGQNEGVGDVTGDGDLDIVTARHGFFNGVNPIEVFMNQLTPDGIVAPVVTTAPSSQRVAPGSSATFKVSATGTGPLTYQWELNGLDISGATSSSYTVSNVQTSQSGGIYRCIVGNPHGLIPSAGATLTVANNPGPTVSAGSNKSVNFPLAVSLSGSVTESTLPPGGTLTSTWSKVSGTGSVTFADASSAATTATFSSVGTYVLKLSASDGTVTNSSQVTITVSPDPGPTVSAGSAQTINFPSGATLNGSVVESPLASGLTLTSTWSQTSGPGIVSFADTSSATTTAAFPAPGTYVLQLQGTDGIATNSSSVTITVKDLGPTVSAGSNQSITLPFNSVQLNGSDSETAIPPGQTLTSTWSEISGPAAASFADVSAPVTTATFTAPGSYVLQLLGSDGITSNTSTLTITVGADPGPTVSAGPAQTIALPTNSVSLAGSVTQSPLPQGTTLASSWTQISGPGATTFADATAAATTATFPSAGTYVLQLAGSDGTTTNHSQVTIVVSPPGPVVIAGSDQTITLPNTAALNGSVTETNLPLGGSLSSTWSQISGPGTTTFANASNTVTNASFDLPGNYVLQLAGSDGVYTNTSQLTVHVKADPGPAVSAGSNQTVNFPAGVQLAGSVTETNLPAGFSLSSTWTQLSGPGTATFSNASSPTTSATFSGAGSYVLQLSGTDGITTNVSTVTILVNPDPGPSVSAGSNQTVTLPNGAIAERQRHGEPACPRACRSPAPGRCSAVPAASASPTRRSPATTASFSAAGTYVLQLSGTRRHHHQHLSGHHHRQPARHLHRHALPRPRRRRRSRHHSGRELRQWRRRRRLPRPG